MIDRLLPHVGHDLDNAEAPWSVFEPLITGGHEDLALRYARGRAPTPPGPRLKPSSGAPQPKARSFRPCCSSRTTAPS